jgi:hypothetical protein
MSSVNTAANSLSLSLSLSSIPLLRLSVSVHPFVLLQTNTSILDI